MSRRSGSIGTDGFSRSRATGSRVSSRGSATRGRESSHQRSGSRSTSSGFRRGGASRGTYHGGRSSSNSHRGHATYGGRYDRHNHRSHRDHHYRHGYYDRGWYIGWSWSYGLYAGYRYYYPYRSWGRDYAFYYSAPVSYAYVPYGFYGNFRPVYVDRIVYVNRDYPVQKYEVVEPAEAPAGNEPDAEQEVLDPKPAADTPTVERFLRDGSTAFAAADYFTAAEQFRLAAISSPEHAGSYFALGQALLALGKDAYAARVIRRAVELNPRLVQEGGDLVGVYQSQAEFDRVLGELESRAEASPAGSDARFLLGVQYYFSGDPRSREVFGSLAGQASDDPVVAVFRKAIEERFKEAEGLPPIVDDE